MKAVCYIKFNIEGGVNAYDAGWWCAAVHRALAQLTVYLANIKTFFMGVK